MYTVYNTRTNEMGERVDSLARATAAWMRRGGRPEGWRIFSGDATDPAHRQAVEDRDYSLVDEEAQS